MISGSKFPAEMTPEWQQAKKQVLKYRKEPVPAWAAAGFSAICGVSLLSIFGGYGTTIIDVLGTIAICGGCGYWYGFDQEAGFTEVVRKEYERILKDAI